MNKMQIARQINTAIKFLAQRLETSDSEKMEMADLFPAWEADKAYAVDAIVRHGLNADNETQLWRAVQAHISQASWTPDVSPSLFSKVGFTAGGMPVWVQPSGAHDAYQTGDRVSHNGQVWTSDIDGNTWEPGVYGWTQEA